MVQAEDNNRLEYGQFVELLNIIRSKGLITAKERRELDQRWRNDQEHRDLVLEEVERIIELHSEDLILKNKYEGS